MSLSPKKHGNNRSWFIRSHKIGMTKSISFATPSGHPLGHASPSWEPLCLKQVNTTSCARIWTVTKAFPQWLRPYWVFTFHQSKHWVLPQYGAWVWKECVKLRVILGCKYDGSGDRFDAAVGFVDLFPFRKGGTFSDSILVFQCFSYWWRSIIYIHEMMVYVNTLVKSNESRKKNRGTNPSLGCK